MRSFETLGLSPQLLAGLGYETPTPIQSTLIPVLLDGQDAIGQAQTGTGKTAAFALPTIQQIEARTGFVQALVLVPTRELATQVASAVFTYGKSAKISVLPIFGGTPYDKQIRRLRKGIDVVVGTPGRLLDLLNRGVLDLSQVRTVILDEADEMLSMGFADDMEAILDQTPAERQTVLISATMPSGIRKLADRYLDSPVSCQVAHQQTTANRIEHRHYLLHGRDKNAALLRLLETEDVESALVFVRTRNDTTEVANFLAEHGFDAEALSGEMTQPQRDDVLRRFRTQRIQVLVGTDVAARGLDIDHISHVFNVDLPHDAEVFVHRVGRTGRAGRTGTAITFVKQNQLRDLKQIERKLRHDIPRATLPTPDAVRQHRDRNLATKLTEALQADHTRAHTILANLVADGHDPLDLAAAALTMASKSDERPILHVGTVKARDHKTREHKNTKGSRTRERAPRPAHTDAEAGMVKVQINAGKVNGVRPGQVVSALARTADIPGKSLGRITIGPKSTYVDVPQEHVGRVLNQEAYRFGKRMAKVRAV